MGAVNRLIETIQIVQGLSATDMTAGATGDYVSLRKFQSCLVLFEAGGTMGATCNLTLNKATDVTPTGATTLAFTTYWSKASSAGTWTAGTASSTIATGTTTDTLYAIQVNADTLGLTGTTPYTAIAGVISAGGSTNYMSLKYLLFTARYAQDTLISAIID